MLILQLFWVFIQVGALSIGGGYASIPIIKSHVVDHYAWLSLAEMTNLITIAEMTPGPIGINCATFVGMQIGGIVGAVVATLGFVLPSVIIVSLFAFIYLKYKKLSIIQSVLKTLRPAVVALIASAGLSILILTFWGEAGFSTAYSALNLVAVAIFAASIFVLRKFKLNPILVILGAGIVGGAVYLLI